ncbi:MAG: hypothetical protein K8T90_18100 [Planctomycetes bacterium]|nr:hypothetical protein [Planctomycetota bacterium]
MLKKFIGLAALAVATTACHSNGTYLQNAEAMPRGPGVVDCHWFARTENSYVLDACRTQGPVKGLYLTSPVAPRAPQVPNVICPIDETVTTSVGGIVAGASQPRAAVVVRGSAPTVNVASMNVPSMHAPEMRAPTVAVSTSGIDRSGFDRPARVAAGRDAMDAVTPTVTMPSASGRAWIPEPPTAPSAGVTISPGVNFGDAVPTWDEPVPPPKPGARLPAPASINVQPGTYGR